MKNITITGFEHYLIDKNGIVYNTIQNNGFGGKQIRKKPRQLKSWPNKNTAYHTVVLRNGVDKPICQYVHRLVALAYLPNPLNLPEVNHKDFDVSNNKLENLEWVTTEQNAHHRRTQKTKSQYTPKIDAVVSNPTLLKEGIELYKKHGRLDAITELWNCSTIYCSNILKMNGVKIFKKNKLSHYLKVKLLFEYENTNMKPRHFKEYIKDKYKLDITGYLYVELRKGLPEKSYTNHA
jgi:hypothetical protein